MLASTFCRDVHVTAEDRIRDLCARLLTAQDDDEVQKLVTELKAAIHDHCVELKVLAAVSFPKNG